MNEVFGQFQYRVKRAVKGGAIRAGRCHDLRMHLALHPGANRDNALQALRTVSTKVENLHTGFRGDATQLVLAYLEWANETVAQLTNQVSDRDIERLVFTRRYEHLLANAAHFGPGHLERFTNSLVRLELQQRRAAFEEAVSTLQSAIKRRVHADLNVLFDTSVFIHHPAKLEAIDWATLMGHRERVNLLVPMIVIDELDKLKEASKREARWRARYTLAVIDRLFPTGNEPFVVLQQTEPGAQQTAVAVEILYDPPQHARLPSADDEIIDRALAMQPLVGRVRLFTYDTGQSTRARKAGLDVVKLPMLPEGDEPARS
ncbi:PIN domain-containing protein [Kitasatospora purpeofusca]|uniref:PIN domain-containing protein n=1 Tax=Kitasatospora purpeofusca TaxID=67352 RepID=UPI0035DC45A2